MRSVDMMTTRAFRLNSCCLARFSTRRIGQCRFPIRLFVMSESVAVPSFGRKFTVALRTRMSNFPLLPPASVAKVVLRSARMVSTDGRCVISATAPFNFGALDCSLWELVVDSDFMGSTTTTTVDALDGVSERVEVVG